MCTLLSTLTFHKCSSRQIAYVVIALMWFEVIVASYANLVLMRSQILFQKCKLLDLIVAQRVPTMVLEYNCKKRDQTDRQTETSGPIRCYSLMNSKKLNKSKHSM
jgi:hypothetical protein